MDVFTDGFPKTWFPSPSGPGPWCRDSEEATNTDTQSAWSHQIIITRGTKKPDRTQDNLTTQNGFSTVKLINLPNVPNVVTMTPTFQAHKIKLYLKLAQFQDSHHNEDSNN